MNKIAFIIGETFLYWNSIFLALGVLAAVCLFLAFYLGRSGNGIGAFLTVPITIVFSLVLSRLVHWYCKADSYASLESALTDYTSGTYALCGVFAGAFLTACALRLMRAVRNLPQLLDTIALAGVVGIGVGRFGCLFTSADRGDIVSDSWTFPFTWPVPNAVTGAPENRIAVFMIQAAVCGVIFIALLLYWLVNRQKGRDGDTCLLFLLFYGASQAVLDSMRYDALYLRSNGFVSLVQILGALGVVLAVIVFSVRMVRSRGWRWWYLGLWFLIAGLLGGAGYMEYHVQRHGDQALFAYTVMSGCLFAVTVLGAVILGLAGKKAKKRVPMTAGIS